MKGLWFMHKSRCISTLLSLQKRGVCVVGNVWPTVPSIVDDTPKSSLDLRLPSLTDGSFGYLTHSIPIHRIFHYFASLIALLFETEILLSVQLIKLF